MYGEGNVMFVWIFADFQQVQEPGGFFFFLLFGRFSCSPDLPGTCYVADMFACKKKSLPYLEVMVWTKLVDRPYVKSRVWV